jgi:hypothetical protein
MCVLAACAGGPDYKQPAEAGRGPDPTLLPVATVDQIPLTTAYNALNVPSMAAGSSYRDPTTNVKVYKLTSATFPASRPSWGHDYSEGGAEVSLPWSGTKRTVKVFDWSGSHWLIDFDPQATPALSNPRQLTGALHPTADISFAFSLNPANPYYAYLANGQGQIVRIDVRTTALAPGGGFPVATNSGQQQWLTQSEGDTLFAWLDTGTTNMTAYEPATGTKKTAKFDSGHQVQVDKGGRYIFWSLNGNAGLIWDFTTGAVLWNIPGDPGIPFAHTAMLRRRIMVTDWNASFPGLFGYLIVDQPNSQKDVSGPYASSLAHQNGGWVQNPPNLGDQWAVVSHEGPPELGQGFLAPSGIILWTINGGRRLLAHSYQTSSVYRWSTFAKLTPDGSSVLFTSDMNGSGRSDVFLAELPAVTPPVLNSLSPANTAADAASVVLTVNGARFGPKSLVQWNGTSLTTTFISDSELKATIPATDVATPGTAQVTVVNPATDETSNPLTFTIDSRSR